MEDAAAEDAESDATAEATAATWDAEAAIEVRR